MDLPDRVLRALRHFAPLGPGARVLLSASGGADSTALVHLVAGLADELEWEDLAVAHLDHRLRDESGDDAAFVAELAGRLGLPLVSGQERPLPRGHEGLEAAAREVRYGFLARAAQDRGAGAVLTGHHMDDQAETVLFRALRGTGPEGLRAMRPVTPLQRSRTALLIRPLLSFRRSELREWLRAEGHSWREDPTNAAGNTRARLRNEALPLLTEVMGRDPAPLLARLSHLCADWADERDAMLLAGDLGCEADDGGGFVFGPRFTKLSPAVQREVIRDRLGRLRGGVYAPSHDEVNRLLSAVLRPPGSPVRGVAATRLEDGGVLVCPDAGGPEPTVPWPRDLPIPGHCPVPGGSLSAERAALDLPRLLPLLRGDRGVEVVDGDLLPAVLTVRCGAPGERFHPLGAAEPARLTHYLQRRGIAAWERRLLPVACDGDDILWVPGQGIADRVRVTDRTQSLVLLRSLAD